MFEIANQVANLPFPPSGYHAVPQAQSGDFSLDHLDMCPLEKLQMILNPKPSSTILNFGIS